jgi:hypothetical protein
MFAAALANPFMTALATFIPAVVNKFKIITFKVNQATD